MLVCFVRCGQTKLDEKEKECVCDNSSLSNKGKRQMALLAEAIKLKSPDVIWNAIIVEDTQAAKETSLIIQKQDAIPIYLSQGLRGPQSQNDKKRFKNQGCYTYFEPLASVCLSDYETEELYLKRIKNVFVAILKRFFNSNIIVITSEKTLSVIFKEFLHFSNVVWPWGCARIVEFKDGEYLRTIRKVI